MEETTKIVITIGLFILLWVELKWSPRFDLTPDDKLFLWYGKKDNRKHIKIF